MASAVALRAVNQIGHRFGQGLVRFARAGIFRVLLFQRFDFFLRQKREEFQVADDVAVVGVDPELVEAIDAGAFRIEPDGAGFGLAEFRAVGVGDERQRQAIRPCLPSFLRVRSMPAVMLPHWSLPPICSSQLWSRHSTIEIERLEQHVAELGVADARLAVFHPGADAFLGDHLVDGKMLADVAQEIEERNVRRPGGVVHQPRRIWFRFRNRAGAASCSFTLAMLRSRISLVSNWRSCVLPLGSPMEPVAPPATAMG